MKNKVLLTITIILIVIAIPILFYQDNKTIPDYIKIETNENIFPVFERHKVKELIKESNVDILSNEEELERETI